jgi:hypothetical protein
VPDDPWMKVMSPDGPNAPKFSGYGQSALL